MFKTKGTATKRREEIRKEFWRDERAWNGVTEKGWFCAPRTLPLVLVLLSMKEISGKIDLTQVYVELLARHKDSGIVEMVSEGEHSFAAGYPGTRGIRTWQERMKLLEQLGFIRSKQAGNLKYKYVMLIHPTVAVQKLREAGKIPDKWWESYRAYQIDSNEAKYEDLVITKAKVLQIKTLKLKISKERSKKA